MLNPQGYGYGGMNPYGQRPVQQRPPQRPSQQQQQQQRPATAPAAGKQGSQGTSSQVKQGQPLKQQQQAAAPVATRPGVPGAVKPAPGTANQMLANIPKEDKTVLGLHLEKASLIEMLQAERSRSGKQASALVDLANRAEMLEQHAAKMEALGIQKSDETVRMGQENIRTNGKLHEISSKVSALEKELKSLSGERDKEKDRADRLSSERAKDAESHKVAMERSSKEAQGRVEVLLKELAASKASCGKIGGQLAQAVKEREAAITNANEKERQAKALKGSLDGEIKASKMLKESKAAAESASTTMRKEILDLQKMLSSVQADRDKAIRLATDAKAQIKSMADGNDAVMDMRVQELRDELERESEIRLTTEQAMRLLVEKSKVLEGERDAGLEQAQEMAVIIGGKEKQLEDLRGSLSELGKEAAEAKSIQVRLEEELRKAKEDLEGSRNDLETRGAKLVILQSQVEELRGELHETAAVREAALGSVSSLEMELEKSKALLSAKLDAEVLKRQAAEKEAELKAKELEERIDELTKAAAKHAEERDAARDKIKEMTEASSSAESVGNERLKGWEEQKSRADGLDKELEAARKTIDEVEKAAKEAAVAAEAAHKGLEVALQGSNKAAEQNGNQRDVARKEVESLKVELEGSKRMAEKLKQEMVEKEHANKAEQGSMSASYAELQSAWKKAQEKAIADLSSKDKVIGEREKERDAAKKRIGELETRIKEASEAAAQTAKEVQKLKGEAEAAAKSSKADKDALSKRVSELGKEVEAGKQALEGANKELDARAGVIERMRKENGEMVKQIGDYKIQVQTIGSDSVKNINAQKASAEAALSKAVDEHKKALDAMRAASKKEVEAVTAAVTKEKAEVEAAMAKAAADHEQVVTSLKSKMDGELKKLLEESKKTLETAQQTFDKDIKSAQDTGARQAAELQAQLRRAKDDAAAQAAEAKKQHEEALADARKGFDARIAEVKAQHDTAMAKVQGAMKEGGARSQETVIQLQSQVQSLLVESNAAKQDLATEKAKNGDAHNMIQAMEKSLKAAAGDLVMAKEQHERKVKELEGEIKAGKEKSAQEASEMETIKQQVARQAEKISVGTKQVAHLESYAQGLEAEKKKTKEQLDSALAQASSEKEVMQKQFEALGAKLVRTQDECRNLSAQVDQLRQGMQKDGEEKKVLSSIAEQAKQDKVTIQQLQQQLEAAKKQTQGLGLQSMQLVAEKSSTQAKLEELTLQFGKDREVLHVQLNEANAKLAMAAEALRISGQQTQEITNLEHQVRLAAKQREEDRMKIVSMDAQLNQTSSGTKLQLDRANERIAAYERALFDARQTLASKDGRIAELESSISRLHQAASRATSASPGNYRSFGGRGDGPSTPGQGISTGEKTMSPGVVVAQMQGGDGNDVGIAQVRMAGDEGVGVFDIPDPSQQYM